MDILFKVINKKREMIKFDIYVSSESDYLSDEWYFYIFNIF